MKFITVSNFGCICYMPYSNFKEELHTNEKRARDILRAKDIEHIIYGYIRYNADDNIDMCYLDILPMNDEEFYKRTCISHHLIYAIHKNS